MLTQLTGPFGLEGFLFQTKVKPLASQDGKVGKVSGFLEFFGEKLEVGRGAGRNL